MSDLRLMIPGPVDAEEAVLSALGEPTLPHYGVEWMPLFRETTDMLKRLFETENDVLIMPGPGTAALDAAIGSLVPAGSSVCIPVNGFFGMRLRQVAEGYGLAVSSLDFPEGTHIDPDEVRRHLKDSIPRSQADGQPIRALAVVHHETSTGVLNPLREIVAVAHEFDLPVIVDAVASLGGVRLPVDGWGIDVCVTVANKCLGAPPGVALLSVSRRAWELAGANPSRHGWYADLRTWAEYRRRWPGWHPYPTTLPTNNIVALHQALRQIFEEGVDAHFESIARAARRVRDGMAELGFTLFPEPDYAAPMVSALKNRPDGIDLDKMLVYLLRKRRIMVSGGIADLHGRIFRVGHMGRARTPEYTEALLEGTRAYLRSKGLDV